MKYFTPELLARYGSETDSVADQAQAEWEQASDTYARHFESIAGLLPPKFRSVLERYYLHDARLFGIALEPPYLFLTMQLDTPPHEVLTLQYLLLKEPEAGQAGQGSDPCPFTEWLYDEVELKQVDGITYFQHSVLFTNGMELCIPFLHFDCLVQPPPSMQPWSAGRWQFPVTAARPPFISSDARGGGWGWHLNAAGAVRGLIAPLGRATLVRDDGQNNSRRPGLTSPF